MTNKERYKQAFSVLHTSAKISLEVDNMKKDRKQKNINKIAIAVAAVIVCFAGVNGICYAKTGQSLIKKFYEFQLANGVDVEIKEGVDGNEEYALMAITGDVEASYILVENDRLYFVFDNTKTDITDECDAESYYRYDYTDESGLHHVIIVGGTIDDAGWAEYVFDTDENYVANFMNIPGNNNNFAGWLLNAEHSLGVPTGEPE